MCVCVYVCGGWRGKLALPRAAAARLVPGTRRAAGRRTAAGLGACERMAAAAQVGATAPHARANQIAAQQLRHLSARLVRARRLALSCWHAWRLGALHGSRAPTGGAGAPSLRGLARAGPARAAPRAGAAPHAARLKAMIRYSCGSAARTKRRWRGERTAPAAAQWPLPAGAKARSHALCGRMARRKWRCMRPGGMRQRPDVKGIARAAPYGRSCWVVAPMRRTRRASEHQMGLHGSQSKGGARTLHGQPRARPCRAGAQRRAAPRGQGARMESARTRGGATARRARGPSACRAKPAWARAERLGPGGPGPRHVSRAGPWPPSK